MALTAEAALKVAARALESLVRQCEAADEWPDEPWEADLTEARAALAAIRDGGGDGTAPNRQEYGNPA